jgi:predicted MFS family arabinose efflux permease
MVVHFGWRTVFLVAGGPGVLLAVLLYFTTREPVRGVFDAEHDRESATDQKAPSAIGALRSILGNRTLCLAILAVTITLGVSYSAIIWTTSFLVRVHGMSVGEATVWMGMGFGVCMTTGSLIAGPVADRVSNGDRRKLALVPAVATFIAAVAGAVLAMGSTLPLVLVGLGVFGFMTGVYVGPGYTIILSLAAPNERGTTMAITKLVTTLLGSSAITYLTGVISDAVGGADSIRPALLSNAAILLLATVCFMMIYRIQSGNAATSVIAAKASSGAKQATAR